MRSARAGPWPALSTTAVYENSDDDRPHETKITRNWLWLKVVDFENVELKKLVEASAKWRVWCVLLQSPTDPQAAQGFIDVPSPCGLVPARGIHCS